MTGDERVDVSGERPTGGEWPTGGPACDSDHCITCGDVAVEVRIVRVLPDGLAVVDTGEGEETVSVALVSAAAGDTVLVHAGEALTVVGPRGRDLGRDEVTG